MRIISGSLGGRLLKTPGDGQTRPAMAKTREALFSMLEARGMVWDGARVLDLYAGSGSLAFECLSRGAGRVCMVDKATDCLQANALALDVAEKCEIRREDVLKYIRTPPLSPFNLVFIDPPYRKNLAQPVFTALEKAGWLAPGAFVAAELERGAGVKFAPTPLVERLFGQTLIRLWKTE